MYAMQIINSLMKIQERSNVLWHGQEIVFDGLNLAEVHCIDWIGMIDHANVTKVANEMGMTRGGISKISQKLLNKGLIESYQRPENNKEIYYRLTNDGQHVYNEHKKCHSKAKQEKLSILSAYSDKEQVTILRFLNDINHMLDSKMSEEISKGE
ncbi:DNA-binding MarR family transcriptional regulator [Sporomusaceae bacterium BoRhaA]|uniref:MarR family winged helix-turn-helix transcriptional regulator n=1 Tax=Pelorhabdus rhamnosifermentans TaxID=2772457 RepID=UPI001C0614F9|nr:MarR family winged helix-turn-helix transcriptional regulator [Pelorhabdus rhamnosifermentans]MBU2701360.1 DNA-binding MarR family transcriptional regulator [Pelorhabdus rhamnosifermentans]